MAITISPIELLALKKLAVVCGALAQTLQNHAGREQKVLTSVLLDVCNRAEVDNASPAAAPDTHAALKFIQDLAEEELQYAKVGTGAEVALRHIARRAQ